MQADFEFRFQSRESDRLKDIPMTPWAKSLQKVQENLQSRMQARAAVKKQRDQVKHMTAWGQGLLKEQEELEAQVESLKQKRSSREQSYLGRSDAMTPWAWDLVQIQQYFEEWDTRRAQVEGRTE